MLSYFLKETWHLLEKKVWHSVAGKKQGSVWQGTLVEIWCQLLYGKNMSKAYKQSNAILAPSLSVALTERGPSCLCSNTA